MSWDYKDGNGRITDKEEQIVLAKWENLWQPAQIANNSDKQSAFTRICTMYDAKYWTRKLITNDLLSRKLKSDVRAKLFTWYGTSCLQMQRSDWSIDLMNEQHDNESARTLTEFRSEAPKNSNSRVRNIDFKNAQCMMSSLHDSCGVTSASIHNFRLPFAYVSYYSQ